MEFNKNVYAYPTLTVYFADYFLIGYPGQVYIDFWNDIINNNKVKPGRQVN